MKKLFALLLSLLLITIFSLSAFAASEGTYVYEIDGVTVIFEENNTLDAATREMIAHKLVHGDEDATTYGLMCTLFGHKYEVPGVITITHCVEPTQPRCLEEYFDVSVCTRCEDTIVDRTGWSYITCCPNDA